MSIEYKNRLWDIKDDSLISVITPFFNRANVIDRALESVNKQTYRDFEYIIVDDGSIENCDAKIKAYIDSVDFPCVFLKKENGGAHTAKNCGVKKSRGRYIVFLDSDDEFVPEALERFIYEGWDKISNHDNDYFEIKMRCINQNGIEIGDRFPDGINDLPHEQALRIYENTKGEHIGMRLGDIMRMNPWPEPKGVTFVTEDILWCKLRRQYKAFFSNQIVRIYHTDSSDSLDRRKNNNTQQLINTLWNITYMLNDWNVFKVKYGKAYLKYILLYNVLSIILRKKKSEFERCTLIRKKDKILAVIMIIPAVIIKPIYSFSRGLL